LLVMMLVPSKGVAIMIKTDTQLQTDVMAELQWDPQINASHIGVQVNDGVVTLSGVVTDAPQKWCAERAALRVDGVQALAVELTVALPDAERRSDSDISHAAATALQLMGLLKGHAIKVMVENGWITLSGDVEWTTSASRHAFAAPSVWCDRHKQCHQPAQQTHQLCGAAACKPPSSAAQFAILTASPSALMAQMSCWVAVCTAGQSRRWQRGMLLPGCQVSGM
jgi:osmotically-inducible protein OsmY